MKKHALIKELERRRIKTGLVVPPAFWFAWKLGVNVSPPFYWTAMARLVFLCVPLAVATFAILVGLDAFVRKDLMEAWVYGAFAVGVGCISSIMMDLVLKFYRKRLHSFPRWESFN